MIKKTITFEDYNGKTITEDYFFHLNKAELVEMEVSTKEGLSETLKKLVASNDGGEIIGYFKKIVLQAYGIKSEDGRRFIKSDDIRDGFVQSDAYPTLFMELATDAKAATEFIAGVVPSDLAAEAEKAATTVEELPQEAVKDPKNMTREELLQMFKEKQQG